VAAVAEQAVVAAVAAAALKWHINPVDFGSISPLTLDR